MQIQHDNLKDLLLDTLRVGGGLVFLTSDQTPNWCSEYLKVFQGQNFGRCSIEVRSFTSLSSGRVIGHSQDLICVKDSDVSYLSQVGKDLQGQRLVFATASESSLPAASSYVVDFQVEAPTVSQWDDLVGKALSLADHESRAEQYSQTHQAPCLFLDRDDVIIKNVPYNTDVSKVELRDGVIQLLQEAHKKGHWVAMVTNQAGLGRQRFHWEDLRTIQQRVLELLAEQGCWIDECVWAGYIPKSEVTAGQRYASLRKPRHGMFQMVQDKLKANLETSTMVGDSATDLIAAYYAGVKNFYLLEVEKSEKEKATLLAFQQAEPSFTYHFVKHLKEVKI